MRKLLHLLLLLPVFLLPCGLFAEVVLTDEQAQELEATLDELEIISLRQKQTISDLRKQNSELENRLNELETQADERQNLLNQQEKTLNKANSSLTRQEIFSILQNVLITIVSCCVGIVIGLFI